MTSQSKRRPRRAARLLASSVVGITASLLLVSVLVQTATAAPSETGTRSLQELGACLAETHQADVLLLVDESGSLGRTDPADIRVPAARRYLPGTMVLETSWGSPTGWVIVRDVLLVGPWRHLDDRSATQRRAPTDYDASHILLRMVRCVNGEMQLTLDCEPVFDYGRELGRWSYTEEGYRQGACRSERSDVELVLTSDMNIGFEGPRAIARTLIKEGEQRFCALSWQGAEVPRTTDDAYRRLVWTAHHWQHWLARGTFPDHPWRSYLERSALTLKGLTYGPSGAVIAAPPKSLPATPAVERNWG